MQSVSSRIWTRVAVSISYDDNHYTKVFQLSTPHKRYVKTIILFKENILIWEYTHLATQLFGVHRDRW